MPSFVVKKASTLLIEILPRKVCEHWNIAKESLWALKEEERQEGKLFVTCYVSAFALKNGADGLCFSKRWHDAIFNQTTSQEFANQWNPTPNSCSWDKLQVPPHWKLYSKVHDLLEFYVSRAIFLTTSNNYWSARQVFWCNYLSRKNILWSDFWHK
jgi:hypothetical protein